MPGPHGPVSSGLEIEVLLTPPILLYTSSPHRRESTIYSFPIMGWAEALGVQPRWALSPGVGVRSHSSQAGEVRRSPPMRLQPSHLGVPLALPQTPLPGCC